jgi:hypothetical protein
LQCSFCKLDVESECHDFDATTAEENDEDGERRGTKRKRDLDFLYEMDASDGVMTTEGASWVECM